MAEPAGRPSDVQVRTRAEEDEYGVPGVWCPGKDPTEVGGLEDSKDPTEKKMSMCPEKSRKDPTEVGGLEDSKRASGRALASVQKHRIEGRAGRRRCAGASRPLQAFAWTLVPTASTHLDASRLLRPLASPLPRVSLGATAPVRTAPRGTPASTRCRAGSTRRACPTSMRQGPCRTAR